MRASSRAVLKTESEGSVASLPMVFSRLEAAVGEVDALRGSEQRLHLPEGPEEEHGGGLGGSLHAASHFLDGQAFQPGQGDHPGLVGRQGFQGALQPLEPLIAPEPAARRLVLGLEQAQDVQGLAVLALHLPLERDLTADIALLSQDLPRVVLRDVTRDPGQPGHEVIASLPAEIGDGAEGAEESLLEEIIDLEPLLDALAGLSAEDLHDGPGAGADQAVELLAVSFLRGPDRGGDAMHEFTLFQEARAAPEPNGRSDPPSAR